MSTDSDTSSHIRQFGLYRTIDARTEEFLNLSRKRQIRQGCGCAAISTVITVALVIIVLLIYEYSTVTNSDSKTTVSPNWLTLMNTTIDTMPFEVKLNKVKLSLNPAPIQFLPLILKTLKKNRYFDKIIEDPISSSPQYERSEPAEEVYTKNIFSDTRNWMRVPTSRLYAIEYRTSPIIYFKNPTRNIDYFTKIRKIRDYQRVMNYVDKMISEKVSLGTTIPIGKYVYGAYKIPKVEYTTPMTKVEKRIPAKKKYKSTSTQTDRKSNCNCPKRMSDLLSKFMSRLKQILPDLSNELKAQKPCNHSQDEATKEIDVSYLEPQKEAASQMNVVTAANKTNLKYISSTSISHTTEKSNTEQNYYEPVLFEFKEDSTPNSINTLLEASNDTEVTDENDFLYKTNLGKQQYGEYVSKYSLEKSRTSSETPTLTSKSVTTLQEFITQRTSKMPKKNLLYSIFAEKDYEDYKETTPYLLDYFKVFDAHSLGLVKKNIIPNRQYVDSPRNKTNFDFSTDYKRVLEINSSTESSIIENTKYETSDIFTTDTTANSYFSDTTESSVDTTSLGYLTKGKELYKSMMDKTIRSDDITLEEESEKESTDYTEAGIVNLENEIKILNKPKKNTTKENSEYEWELVKVEEDSENKPISMIPQSRSSYLEIQRGEWRNDENHENHDYDNNINNYLFEK